MRVFLFLWIALLTMAQATEGNKPLESPALVNQQALEDLKKQIESLHLLLDQTKRTPVKNNDVLQKRFREALKKANEELKEIDKAVKTYDQGQTDQALDMPWKKFEQNMFSRIASFQDYMQELQKIYVESKEDTTNFRPVTTGKESTRANPVKRARRKKSECDQPPSLHLPSNKGGVRYHITTESTKNPDEEPFLK